MKKTALFVLSGGIGGAESVVKEIFENIDIDHNNIEIITCDELVNEFHNRFNCTVHSIGAMQNGNLMGKIRRVFLYYIGAKLLRKKGWTLKRSLVCYTKRLDEIIRKEHIEIVHAHLVQAIYCLSQSGAQVLKIATIHDAHGLDKMGFDNLPMIDVKEMYEKMDVVTSACQYFFTLFFSSGIVLKRQVIIENGINLRKLKSVHKEAYDQAKFNIVYLGGDREIKGCDYLEKAVNVLVNTYHITDICVHVMRNVSNESLFFKAINMDYLQPYFDIIGYVNEGKHLEYMASADLYILPSKTEGIANTLLEAIGLHLCILATKVGGTPEIIRHYKNGYLVDQNPEEIAMAIRVLKENKEQRLQFSQANAVLADQFDWQRIVKKYEKLYDEM